MAATKAGRKTDAFSTDDTTKVWIEVASSSTARGVELQDVLEYQYDSDIITLFDSFALTVANPDGENTGKVGVGYTVRLKMADPNVEGGKVSTKLLGIVTGVRSIASQGKILVTGADLGWHLANNDAPLWFQLEGGALAALLNFAKYTKTRVSGRIIEIDNGWGFLGFASETDTSRHLNQGRAGIERSILHRAEQGGQYKAFIPPIQVEPGTKIGDLLITYCRREHLLVNVSPDGILQVWQPNYKQEPSYRVEFHADGRRTRNNCLDVTFEQTIDGLYTHVDCVTQKVLPSKFPTREDPNVNKVRGRFTDTRKLPFRRGASFSDSDQIGKERANRRAEWFAQRGEYDSWTYTVEMSGHVQDGIFFAANTMVAVDDSYDQIYGNYYCSAVKYTRSTGNGTRTTLTIKKPGLLSA